MGVLIKSKIDGFRRGGIVHRAKGTYYQDGALTEEQLQQFSNEPQLVVVTQASPAVTADQDDESLRLMQEMGDTIAALENELDQVKTGRLLAVSSLEQANTELEAERSYRLAILDRHAALPGLVVEAAKLLTPADPAQEGVILITADSLVALIAENLQPQQKTPEAQVDGIQSTLGTTVEPPSPTPVQAVATAAGDKPDAVSDEKTGKRTRNKGAE